MTDLKSRLADIVGERHVLAEADREPYLVEERGLYRGEARLVVRPGSTAEVAAVVALAQRENFAIVPQGGNTGLCGGAVSGASEVLVNLGRMNKIRAVDPIDFTLTAEAGCILSQIQDAAREKDCLFPLSLAAEGSCQIGGNLATNAGGVNVLKYGNARDLVLGIEAVLPDGSIWNGLRSLRKDNTGYDLKHLFIGAEGTLGIITAAVLKLFPAPKDLQTALVAIDEPSQAVALLARARALTGDSVAAFELIPRFGLEIVAKHIPGAADPMAEPHPFYVLIELTSSREGGDLQAGLESLLESAFEEGLVADAVIAASGEQRLALWRLREFLPEAQKHEGASIKHDVSVPVSAVPEFLARATQAVEAAIPGLRVCAFGHVGDGNIHFNLTQPPGADKKAYLDRWEEMNRIVHDIVVELNGSFSAEHGIGILKLGEMAHYKDKVELDLMRKIKSALDPRNLMNPGKVVG